MEPDEPGHAPAPRRAGPGYRLVLLRHGESEWNTRNRFTGWVNVSLTPDGEDQATRAGEMLAAADVRPDVVHTSLQRRAIRSADLALAACDREWIAVRRSWRINGRHYGVLQGKDKSQILDEYGPERFSLWRRSYAGRPPPLAVTAEYSQFADPRYAALPPEARPRGESLRDVTARLLPYWYDAIAADLRAGATALVVSHGNTLRALIKHLEDIGDEDIAGLEVPHAVPLLYHLDADLRPVAGRGTYLGEPGAAPGRPG